MQVPFIDIRQQYAALKDRIDADVLEILATGAYVLGKHNEGLERELAELHGVAHAVAVNSGTDALRIALEAAGIGPGDEVVTSAFTFVASVETILQVGARPVFVDIDPVSFQIDAERVAPVLTERTKAIMPIHLFGQMCAMEPLDALARDRGLAIVEDAAQAVGSRRNGRPAGGFGIASALSFYVTKNLGAAGDGGMILTDDADIAAHCRSLRVHGMGRERYYYDHVGYTSRLDELQAAILRAKLTLIEPWTARRRALAEVYVAALSGVEGVALPQTLPGNEHTWHQFTVRARERDGLQAHLKSHGVDSMIYYPVPLHFHRPYQGLAEGPGSLPETERACREVLSLPINPSLSDEQVSYVAERIAEFASLAAAST